VLHLLNADYTFVNQRLAEHYGIPRIYGSQFRRVTLPAGNRRGLLGQGSVLTVTSYPNRTSVVQRGKWVLENLLGTPPPPPPPDVPELKAAPHGKVVSMREQMQAHRANPTCAACHARMDPIGFALENYDAVGRWRDEDAGAPIDASGKLPDGTQRRVNELLLTKPRRLRANAHGKDDLRWAAARLRHAGRAQHRARRQRTTIGFRRFSRIINSTPFRCGQDPGADRDDGVGDQALTGFVDFVNSCVSQGDCGL
jgi:hypothetical protein